MHILIIEAVFRFNLIKNLLLIYKNLYVVFSTILNKKISDRRKSHVYSHTFLVAIRYKAGFLEFSISLPGALTALFFSVYILG